MLKFLGIGAQKAGTSWLHAQLVRHPQIGFPLGKEAHFWNSDRDARQTARYLEAFGDPERCEGEITPAYALLQEPTIRAIHRIAPHLRVLFVLRNPIERAWSSALMALQRAELSIDEVGDGWFLDHFRSVGSLARGDYAVTLRRWRRVFGGSAMLVLRYEDIRLRPQWVVQQCCAHLGVTPADAGMLEACDRAIFAGPGHPLPDHLRRVLESLYRPRIQELERTLDCDLRDWVTQGAPPPRPSVAMRLRRLREERNALRRIRESGLFDSAYYLERYPDVRQAGIDPARHYLRHGASERRNPSAGFDTAAYLASYPDVAAAGLNPLVHYLQFGAAEGRLPRPGIAATPGAPALGHRAAPGRPPFRDFAGFLRHALFVPELAAPFSEEARCVVEHLRARQLHLRRRHASLAADTCISVILTAASRGAGFDRAVRSVLAQTWAHFELLVIDHGPDGRVGALPADSRIRELGRVESGRLGAALQRGLEASRGAYIAYLDAEAQFHPDFLRLMVGELQAHPAHQLAYCAVARHDAQDELSAVHYPVHPLALIENQPCLDLRSVLHERPLVDACGAFDEQMDSLAGWSFLLSASRHTVPLGVACLLSGVHGAARSASAALANDPDLARLDARLLARAVAPRLARCSVPGLGQLYAGSQRRQGRPLAERMISIVIPSFECLDYLRLCIESVRAYTEGPHELIVVDNASSAPVREFLAREPSIRVIQNTHNFGFTYAVNQGIAAAHPSADVILLNNDALVTPGWVQAMQQVLSDRPETGLVVPRQVLPAGTPTIRTHNPAMNPRREAEVNLSLHHDNVVDPLFDAENGYVSLTFAAFFCVYIPRRTLDEVGVLDHENAPHYRSDRLYCAAVRHLAGRPIVYTPHAKLYHFLQRATAQLRVADPQMFQGMFVKNEWAEVTRGAPPAKSGD